MAKQTERRDLILDAALRISDLHGIEAVTIRRIEEETGLSAPLIYRHFRDKDQILAGLVEHLLARATPSISDASTLRMFLEETFCSLYREALRHSVLLTLLSTQGQLQQNALNMSESLLSTLRSHGHDAASAGHIFHVLMSYTVGSIVMSRGTAETDDALRLALVNLPNIVSSGPFLDARSEVVFRKGLIAILDALLVRA